MPDEVIEIDGPIFPTERPANGGLGTGMVEADTTVGPPLLPASEVVEAPVGPTAVPMPHLQENARRRIAYSLIAIFAAEVLFALLAHPLAGMAVPDIKEIMLIVFGSTGALVGSATGFYFGTRAQERSQDTTTVG